MSGGGLILSERHAGRLASFDRQMGQHSADHLPMWLLGRAASGKRILATESQELTVEFGAGFALRLPSCFIPFSRPFPDEEIVSALATQTPPLPLLQTRLHQAIEHAREQAARRAVANAESDPSSPSEAPSRPIRKRKAARTPKGGDS